jgi:threonine aldolase
MNISRGFASDNHSGAHPKIIDAIVKANIDHQIAYGYDKYTKRSIKKFKEHFGKDIDVYFVYNGTAANVLGIKTVACSFNSIICAETAHLNVHECCAPEKFIGCKLNTIKTKNGKITLNKIKDYIIGLGDEHRAQPKVISITQPTELGTIYSINELKELTNFAHENNMFVHVDGARLCNAAVSLNVSLKDITKNVGIDILSFGGTKNGMMYGEAVIFFENDISKDFPYIRKQGMQLSSKMRFIAVQFESLLSNDLWKKNALHSNKMALLLYKNIKGVSKIKITQKVETNAIFAIVPKYFIKLLKEKYFFHVFDEKLSMVRWMCSFDTTEEDVINFASYIKEII